jgi:hypothetical protein
MKQRGRSFTWHTVNYFKHNLMFKPRKQQPPTQSVSQPGNRQLIDVVLASNLGREDKARILAGLV